MRGSIRCRASALTAVLAVLSAVACGDDPIGPQEPEDVSFAPELGIDLDEMTRLPSGVYVQTVREGVGEEIAASGDRVRVTYRLWLPNGTLVRTAPDLSFQLTPDPLFPPEGLVLGVTGMRVEEIRKIVIPSRLAYGSAPPQASGIPPHSVLVFEVELIEIERI